MTWQQARLGPAHDIGSEPGSALYFRGPRITCFFLVLLICISMRLLLFRSGVLGPAASGP